MKVSEMLEKYRRDHQHPVNRGTHMIGIPMIIISLPLFFFHWKWALGLFVAGWMFQFIGHAFEGKKPTFFSNPLYLIIGPYYFLRKLLRKTK
ncbi:MULTISPECIES: Mpo1-like protein [Thermoactinomyces]|jgi:uncharacterized membrane protein YGL010W|uniref:DUF962 domain-containing protein n=1 Tax=Thermoactinomyces vulgaris TaxID=2026 RepID=A0ABS0QEZ7_THEVU|nr:MULTISPECIES: DUF962 domain-containing protein [Thermoactinomyces]KFZ40492.1 permease [Thermoactinomyces sp. Gus2-1]KYQ87887.1 permease [Thermoactinomyces sp. AS95]MBA4550470.1 DUF962 domain-containing protein [Thermoactinomyces vulgaris]MBA4595881.1 DUF962 domain-containing protein [Thermoactinomyces vulgaris]MBH8582354.1 DUF962 domain-containing protein [Thermoactinomyces sp. CICC 10735]